MIDAIRKLLQSLGLDGGADGGDAPDAGGDSGMISCDEALERLFEYLDGELEGRTEEEVARHFEVCQRCYPRLAFEESFREAVHRVNRGEAAPDAVRRKVMEILQEEGLDSS